MSSTNKGLEGGSGKGRGKGKGKGGSAQPNKKRAREFEAWLSNGDTSLFEKINGVIAVYKPEGKTSSDVVQNVRRALESQLFATGVPKRPRGKPLVKVGHGGTLDPLATGVLVVGLGTGCRQMADYLKGTKKYEGLGMLGSEYDTQDCTGKVTKEALFEHVTQQAMLDILPNFTGDIQQIPPMYSALKKDGERLYDIARRGETVEREARKVHISELQLRCVDSNGGVEIKDDNKESEQQLALPAFCLEIECSGGTYIRTMIEDIGRAVDSAAHMTALTRTKQGPFGLDDCLTEGDCNDADKIIAHIETCKAKL